MASFNHQIANLRLGEFDLGGVLYHANYYHLYEAAREALLSAEGSPYSSLVEQGFHLALIEAHQEFKLPIFYGEPISVALSFTDIANSSAKAVYDISVTRNGSTQRVHQGWTRLVFVAKGASGFKPSRVPENLLTIFKKYAEA